MYAQTELVDIGNLHCMPNLFLLLQAPLALDTKVKGRTFSAKLKTLTQHRKTDQPSHSQLEVDKETKQTNAFKNGESFHVCKIKQT